MRKKRLYTFLLFFIAFMVLVNATEAPCAAKKKNTLLLKKADDCRRSSLKSSKKRRYRHNWTKCIKLYKKVYTGYPSSNEAVWALYQTARLYTGLYTYSGNPKDLNEALSLLKKIVVNFSSHRLADDAQYRIGEIYFKYKKDPTQAYVEFLKVDIKFPSGDMRPKAKAMLDKLGATLSKKDEEQAKKDPSLSKVDLISVNDIRHWSTPNYTRVVIDLEGPVKYSRRILKADLGNGKPRRLYLDLQNAKVSKEIDSSIPIKDGLLQRARAAQHSKDSVRVVLDIESIGGFKVFPLHDPYRIVVDVRRAEKIRIGSKSKMATKKRTPRKGIRKTKGPEKSFSLARQLGLSVKRIVIDPGHGGKDPGCHIRGGVREKDIVLNIAKKLAGKIEKNLGCEVFLTRSKDVFVPLERRTAIANMKKADLFISLHINAHKDKSIHGLETYFLNMATDKRAVMAAALENATSEKNISDLQRILNDLMLNTNIHESSRLAHEVHKGVVSRVKSKYRRVRDLGVKQAPFYVLIGAEMPAILIETGFLTNRVEAKRLASKQYQERVAEGISKGVSSYIESIDHVYQGGG